MFSNSHRCVDSVRDQECRDSRTRGWNWLRLRGFVIFGDQAKRSDC